MVATGQVFPPGPQRARMYREALLIVKELLHTGRCSFQGEHYQVDVPVVGPLSDPPPPLVASVGGPWTVKHITPIVDRVELKFGRTTRGGALDLAAMATVTRDELAGMVEEVRAVRDDIPIGLFLLMAVGDSPEVTATAEVLGRNLCGGFVGEPTKVLENLHALREVGISRIQVTELVPGSIAALGTALPG